MSNRLICLIVTVLFSVNLISDTFGQTANLQGEVKYTVTHDWVRKILAVDYISKAQRERMSYVWGNRSNWTEYSHLLFSREATRYEDLQDATAGERGFSYRKDEFIIFRDFENHRTYDVIKHLGRLYLVDDSIHEPQWKILNDMREIAGFICMNAYYEDTLKMQRVTAWFALSLPVPSGPERFGGLPGLILEVNINNGALIITAESVNIRQTDKELTKPYYKRITTISEDKYRLLLQEHFEKKRKEEEPPFFGIRY